jgi:hypothetical protein
MLENFFFILQFTIVNAPIYCKLQTLHPSAIDKCATVFAPPLAAEKKEIEGDLLSLLRILQNARSIHSGFYK